MYNIIHKNISNTMDDTIIEHLPVTMDGYIVKHVPIILDDTITNHGPVSIYNNLVYYIHNAMEILYLNMSLFLLMKLYSNLCVLIW